MGSTVSPSNRHNRLKGLDADDHPQYLLRSDLPNVGSPTAIIYANGGLYYGIRQDGSMVSSGAEPKAVWKATIDAVGAAGGGIVLVRSGNYLGWTGVCDVEHSRVLLWLEPGVYVEHSIAMSDGTIRFRNSGGAVIEDVGIIGGRIARPMVGGDVIQFYKVHGGLAERVHVVGGPEEGIIAYYSDAVHIIRCRVEATGGGLNCPIQLYDSHNCMVAECEIEMTGVAAGTPGIMVTGDASPPGAYNPPRQNTIRDNHILNAKSSGIQILNGARDCRVSGNIIESPAGDGILVHPGSASACPRNRIEGNIIYNAGGAGINVLVDDTVVVGNRVYNPVSYGIRVYQKNRAQVLGNHIEAAGDDGIHVNLSEGTLVQGNRLYLGQKEGIQVANGVVHSIISGNVIVDNGQAAVGSTYDGIQVSTAAGATCSRILIVANVISGAGHRNAIRVTGERIIVRENSVDGSTSALINHAGGSSSFGCLYGNNLGWSGILALASSRTCTDEYDTYYVDASGIARTLTLPTAVGREGIEFCIIKADSSVNAVNLARTGSETIGGATSLTLSLQNASVRVRSDGANWLIVGRGS